jgi:hypothetical protein
MSSIRRTATPACSRLGPGLDETLELLQKACVEQGLARSITEHKEAAVIDWR